MPGDFRHFDSYTLRRGTPPPKAGMIYVGLPTYDGSRLNSGAVAQLARRPDVVMQERAQSLLCQGFNALWASALNARQEYRVRWFLLLHADILPTAPTWVDTLLREAERMQADVLSVVVPLKSTHGETSTALETGDLWSPRRLSLAEAHDRPATFTEPGLLVNTGCLLVRFTVPWVERIAFTIQDRMRRHDDGTFVAEAIPEDWDFSRQVRRFGGSVWATTAVSVRHLGTTGFSNAPVGRALEELTHA